MNVMPLRYNISDWHQAVECLSNNSASLHIHVADYLQNDSLQGTKISVVHDTFGVLFAYVVDPHGEIVSDMGPMLSTSALLKELARYGFLITYTQWAHLPGDQIQFLMTLRDLKFDKIRLIDVKDPSTGLAKTYVIVFKIENHPEWLDNTAAVYKRQFDAAVSAGSVFNVSLVSECENYRWDWLADNSGFVANIDDIIAENA